MRRTHPAFFVHHKAAFEVIASEAGLEGQRPVFILPQLRGARALQPVMQFAQPPDTDKNVRATLLDALESKTAFGVNLKTSNGLCARCLAHSNFNRGIQV